jgi:hypothetical protein
LTSPASRRIETLAGGVTAMKRCARAQSKTSHRLSALSEQESDLLTR